jgi:hypothetical protein
MKALFKNRFPFVELPDEELTGEQLTIKKQYEESYPISTIEEDKGNVVFSESIKTETYRLRKVRPNEGGSRK